MNQKLRFLCFRGIHNSLPSFWAKLGYSRIKIDHIADSLLKLQIKIGVHLINVERSQLLTPVISPQKWISDHAAYNSEIGYVSSSTFKVKYLITKALTKYKRPFVFRYGFRRKQIGSNPPSFLILAFEIGNVSNCSVIEDQNDGKEPYKFINFKIIGSELPK